LLYLDYLSSPYIDLFANITDITIKIIQPYLKMLGHEEVFLKPLKAQNGIKHIIMKRRDSNIKLQTLFIELSFIM